MDVLNCDGMTAEQARAALRAHCRAQEALLKASRDKRAEHLRVNSGRLGWVVGHPPARPKKFPVRVGQRPEIRFNGRRALVAATEDAFIGFDSGHPVKRLTFEIVAGRYDCFRVTAILEDEDLTQETYWLSGCDVSEVTRDAIRFCSGFELAARDGAAAFAVHPIPEPEVAASRLLLKAAAALQQADAAQPSKEARKRQAVKRAVKVSQAAKDFSVSRPTINKWERGEGKPPENFTLSDLKIYKLCLLAYEKQEQFNDAVVARLKNGKTFSGKQKYQTRKVYRGDIGHGREADYQHPDPNEQ